MLPAYQNQAGPNCEHRRPRRRRCTADRRQQQHLRPHHAASATSRIWLGPGMLNTSEIINEKQNDKGKVRPNEMKVTLHLNGTKHAPRRRAHARGAAGDGVPHGRPAAVVLGADHVIDLEAGSPPDFSVGAAGFAGTDKSGAFARTNCGTRRFAFCGKAEAWLAAGGFLIFSVANPVRARDNR